MSEQDLKKTPLNAEHRALGGKMVDFGGWDMPVQYTAGVIAEHMATRTRSGLFDVSHMGEIWVDGPDAISFVNGLTTNDVTKLVDGCAVALQGFFQWTPSVGKFEVTTFPSLSTAAHNDCVGHETPVRLL